MSEIIWTDERKKKASETFLKWKGTPHKNRIAVLGVGIDCIRFVCEILHDCELIERRPIGFYSVVEGMNGESERLLNGIETCLFVERVEVPEFGDIIIFQNGATSGHCAFYAGDDIWHTLARSHVVRSQTKLWTPKFQWYLRIKTAGWQNDPLKKF